MISSGDGCPRSGRSPTAATGHCLLARNARPTAGFAAYNQIRNYRRVVGSGRCEYGDGQLRDGSSATATAYQCDYAHLRCRINSGCSGDQQRVRRWRRADGLSWGRKFWIIKKPYILFLGDWREGNGYYYNCLVWCHCACAWGNGDKEGSERLIEREWEGKEPSKIVDEINCFDG